MGRFLASSPEERALQFKMIANITAGPLVIRTAIPKRPLIPGKAVQCAPTRLVAGL